MKRKNLTRNALFTSILSLLLCVSMLVGTTFAWFTDEAASGINQIVAGNLDVELYTDGGETAVDSNTKLFSDITLWEPGVVAYENLTVANKGNLALKYQLAVNFENATATADGKTLADVLQVGFVEGGIKSTTREEALAEVTTWEPMASFAQEGKLLPANYAGDPVADASEVSETYGIIIYWQPGANDNDYNMNNGETTVLSIDLGVKLFATQLEAEKDSFGNDYDAEASPVLWDGTADTSWYNDTDTEFTITTAEQLAGLAELVNAGNTFEGKTVKLGKNINLEGYDDAGERLSFRPIGDKNSGSIFKGTLDGQNNTIKNLYQNGWAFGYEWGAYGSFGLFGIVEDITVKNLKIDGAESLIEGGDVGGICGSAEGTCVFENITITNSDFATYNNGNGGIIGWSGPGNYTFKNITIAESVELTGLWGSFDSSIGGIVGQGEPGATYNFENVDIACVMNAFNDCTASYDYYNYRMCGMIIGRLQETTTINGTNYPDTSKYNITCNNVTVTYGEWANYHYCDPTPGLNNGRGMRVEPGYSYDGIPADYDHSQCTSHCKELIAFDQVFGGAQLGVKGLPSYEGVNVVYNNK